MASEAFSQCLPPSVAPYHAVCTPPKLVAEAFEKATGRKGVMNAADLATFFRTVQGEGDVTEEEAGLWIVNFYLSTKMKNSGRHLRLPGLSQRSPRSRHHSKRDLSLSKHEPPSTLDLQGFLKFLLSPELNGHRNAPANTVGT